MVINILTLITYISYNHTIRLEFVKKKFFYEKITIFKHTNFEYEVKIRNWLCKSSFLKIANTFHK